MLTKDKLQQVNDRSAKTRIWPLAVIGAGALALATVTAVLAPYPMALAPTVLLAGAAGVWVAHARERRRGTVSLDYTGLEGEMGVRFSTVQRACEDLAASEKIWRLAERRKPPLKAAAGAMGPERERATVGRLETPGIRASVPIWGVEAGGQKILFFPETVVLYRRERYETVPYGAFEVAFSSERFPEEDVLPREAEVTGRTWRYTRPDGSRDRRYADNPELPLVLYGLLEVGGPSGTYARLQVSDRSAASRFADTFAEFRPAKAENAKPRQASAFDLLSVEHRARLVRARMILDVTRDAPMSETTAAYRRMARLYHPDKVATLPPGDREAAERRMKEINEAYTELKPRKNSTWDGTE